MKKFLSLVLALVMTMSLVTISAGAADFTDADSVTYDEAVEVMTAIGVVSGYTDGSFKPGTALNRGQAAKIICNMILGPTTAEALSTTSAPFSDVPADHVFAGYIAYCVSEGIISGYADGTFKPANPLTGYAFWKMLLGALGYDADIEGYNDPTWSVQVAKRGLNIELDKGLKGDFVGTKALTREEACLYAFNTLKADMVDYGNKTAITIGDINITTSADVTVVDDARNMDGLDICDDETLQFAEKYFKDLEGEKTYDNFGRPATKWTWDGDKVGTYTKSPKYTFTFDKVAEAYADFDDVKLKEEIRDITGNKKLDYDGATKLTINGADAQTADLLTAIYAELPVSAGVIFELYTSKNDITEAVVMVPFAAQIDEVEDELSKADTKKGATYEITLKDLLGETIGTYFDEHDNDEELPGFDADTYVEDAVLVVFPNFADGDGTNDPADKADSILASYVAETEEGTLKTWAYTDKEDRMSLRLDETKYPMATTISFDGIPELGEEQTIYMTEEGFVVGIIGATKADIKDVYYVTGVYTTTSTKGTVSYFAETVALDGTQADLKLEAEDDLIPVFDDDEVYAEVGALYILTDKKDAGNKANNGKYDSFVFDYENADEEDNYNGYYVMVEDGELADDDGYADVKATDTKIWVNTEKVYLEDDTTIIGIEKSADDLKVTTAQGGMKMAAEFDTGEKDDDGEAIMEAATVVVLAHIDDTKTATHVLYITEDIDAAVASDEILYITANTDYEIASDSILLNAWFMADVAEEQIEVDEDEVTPGFWHFSIDEDDVYTLEDAGLALTEVEKDDDGYMLDVEFSEDTTHKSALTLSSDIDDVDFSAAKVIDDRDSISGTAWDKEIDSVSDLNKAIKSDDVAEVTANVYVKDGKIVFIVVTDVDAVIPV